MPALTRFYRLTPMDVEQMSLREIETYLRYMDQALQAEGG